ncbi:MAG: PAS domain S-box protein [Anaerolineae bacterium]|nr:PAS domain S-box protein [Anaerolineae bacterium]
MLGLGIVATCLLLALLFIGWILRRRTLLELRRSQKRLSALFEGIDDAVFVHDETGHILDCNQAACTRLGYSRQELLSMRAHDIDAPDFAAGFSDRWVQQIAKGRYHCEGTHIARDGRHIAVDVNTSLIDYQGQKAVLAVVQDITARKAQERQQTLLRSVVQQVKDAVMLVDDDTHVTYVNQAFLDMYGYERDEIVGQRSQILFGGTTEEFEVFSRQLRARVDQHGFFQGEYQDRHKDGSLFWVSSTTSRIYLDEPQQTYWLSIIRDITEQRQAEQGLRESEHKFRMIYDNVFEGISIYQEFPNGTRKLIDCNDRYAEMAGRSKAELMALDNPSRLQAKVSPAFNAEQNLRLRREHAPYTGLFSWLRPDGAPNVIEYAAVPIDVDGHPLTIGFDRDITEYIQTQQNLRLEHDFVSRLMETSPAGIVVVDLKSEIVFANARAEEVFELKRDKQTNSYLAPEWRIVEYQSPYSPENTPLEQVQQTGKPVYNILHTFEWPDGRQKYLSINIAPQFDAAGQMDSQIITTDDVTARIRSDLERQRALEELARSEEKLRLIFDHAFDGISIYEENVRDGKRISRRLIECNERYVEIAGRNKEDLLNIGDTRAIQQDVEYVLTGDQAAEQLLYQGQTYRGRFSWLRPDGQENVIEYNAVPIQVEDKILIVGLDRDITAQVRAEAERQELREKLERAQRMEALGVLAGGVAHDLNNILGPMVAYPDLILSDLPPDSPVRDDVLQIQAAAERAAVVVQDLLTLARRGIYRMLPLNLNGVINEYFRSVSFIEASARHSNVTVEIELEPNPLPIAGSEPHLSKVIMNLVNNAFEAMPYGGQLTVTTQNLSLDQPLVGYERVEAGDYVLLQVSDSGVGIEDKDLDKLFEPFYTTKEMGRSGSGLGLAVIYGVVHDHNGKIDLRTQVGQGTDFVLYFPITREEIPVATGAQLSYRGVETILVVDDLEAQRSLARRLLESLGYAVKTVENGHQAVDYIRQHQVDLVLLDMIMEDKFDGLDTYRAVAMSYPGQKAIIASGFSETARVKEAQKLGAGRFVKKPYTLNDLGEAVRAELDR